MTLGADPLLFSELKLGFPTMFSDLSASLSMVTSVLIWVLSCVTNCPPGCLELGGGGVLPECGTLNFKLSRKESECPSQSSEGRNGGRCTSFTRPLLEGPSQGPSLLGTRGLLSGLLQLEKAAWQRTAAVGVQPWCTELNRAERVPTPRGADCTCCSISAEQLSFLLFLSRHW